MSGGVDPMPAPGGKTYWRSLAELAGTPEFKSFLDREFPEGASELPEGISRRSMLTLLGASLAMAGLAGCRRPVEKIVPYVDAPEEIVPGVPRYFATTMPFGHSAYGLLVASHEGRPTKIEGNPLHPTTAGSSSAQIQAAMLDLYDPDRSQSVLYKGAAKTWVDFIAAWGELSKGHQADGGAGLAVLTESFSSPTLARLAGELRRRFPRLRWVTYEPVSDENIFEGIRRITGQAYQPLYRFDRAKVILSIDSDFLLTESESIAQARGFAEGRRLRSENDSMNRLYLVEGSVSSTGGMADHRLRLQSRRMGNFCAALAAELRSQGLALDLPGANAGGRAEGIDSRWVKVLAHDLMASRGQSLIVAGRRQPPAVHAAVLVMNEALGNLDATVAYREPEDASFSSTADLAGLSSEMRDGKVATLVILGGNPVYNAPADLEFESALSKVGSAIHLSPDLNETSRVAAWHLHQAHFLEAWGDCRAVDGTASVTQPLIAPLFGGRSAVEVLGVLVAGQDQPGYELVRQTWKALLGEIDFEKRWNRVLHDGLLEGALPTVVPPVRAETLDDLVVMEGSAANALEIVFQASPAMHDGRFANNAWLQELPDPVTKITWDNAACVSHATARSLELSDEDMVRLRYQGREIEMPVWIVPGQADQSVSVFLGYGRRSVGRVGAGVGFNAYSIRTSKAPDLGFGLEIVKTGSRYPIAQTQEHGSMAGRPIVREASLDEYHREPDFAAKMVEMPESPPLWKEHEYKEGYQWGMSIDLAVCTGCNACVIACQGENNIPVVGKAQVRKGREMHWIRVDRYFAGPSANPMEDPNPELVFQPIPCMHCENAPCEQVCPVAATVHDAEGLNVMTYNRCIGTRYCSNNCPYKVRRFNFFNYTKDTPEILKMAQNPDVTVRSRGVMEKCTYCTQRIQAAKIDAKLEGRKLVDGDVTTACQQACPVHAIEFGNILDPESRVAKLKAQSRDYALLGELHNRPRTTYLAKIRNPHPELAGRVETLE